MKKLIDLTLFTADTKSLVMEQRLNELLQDLPVSLHARALRYKSEESSYNYVVGRLLLKRGLTAFNIEAGLEDVEFSASGKPTLPNLEFNISHSDSQVVCAFSRSGSIGVDLEKVKPVDFNDFTSMFTANEWKAIHSSANSLQIFYWFWTRKESIIKALGLSLSYLHQIELDVSSTEFIVDGKTWFLRELEIGQDFIAMICSANEIDKISIVNQVF